MWDFLLFLLWPFTEGHEKGERVENRVRQASRHLRALQAPQGPLSLVVLEKPLARPTLSVATRTIIRGKRKRWSLKEGKRREEQQERLSVPDPGQLLSHLRACPLAPPTERLLLCPEAQRDSCLQGPP